MVGFAGQYKRKQGACIRRNTGAPVIPPYCEPTVHVKIGANLKAVLLKRRCEIRVAETCCESQSARDFPLILRIPFEFIIDELAPRNVWTRKYRAITIRKVSYVRLANHAQ